MEQQLTQLRLGWRREHERLKDCVNNVAFLNCFKMFNMVSKFGSCVLLQASTARTMSSAFLVVKTEFNDSTDSTSRLSLHKR